MRGAGFDGCQHAGSLVQARSSKASVLVQMLCVPCSSKPSVDTLLTVRDVKRIACATLHKHIHKI